MLASPLSTEQRLSNLLDHLGIQRAHVALGPFAEQAIDLTALRPDAIASLTFVLAPRRFNADAVARSGAKVTCLAGPPLLPVMVRNLELIGGLEGAQIIDLPVEYDAQPWSDVIKDQAKAVLNVLEPLSSEQVPDVVLGRTSGNVDGISFRIEGNGPALLLFPVNIAPTQWDAVLPQLATRFTCIRVAGPHVGFVQLLESRASTGTYLTGVRSVLDLMELSGTDIVLEVGTGSGPLARDLVRRPNAPAKLMAVDINEFLLDEARGLSSDPAFNNIEYRFGNAESLPFDDASFDAAFGFTVYEECDVEKGLSELRRVVKPGGRVGVITRCRDIPAFWNLEVEPEVLKKINVPQPQTVGPRGSVDSFLYQRFAEYFVNIRPCPFYASVEGIFFDGAAAAAMSSLPPDEARTFESALATGRNNGSAFLVSPYHAVVGKKAQ